MGSDIRSRIPPKPALGCVRDVALYSISHEQTIKRRVLFQICRFTAVFPKDFRLRLCSSYPDETSPEADCNDNSTYRYFVGICQTMDAADKVQSSVKKKDLVFIH